MAISWNRISWLWWGKKKNEPISNNPSMNSVPDWGFGLRDQDDNSKFGSSKMASSNRKVKKKRKNREERRTIDKEYDAVLVPSDGFSSLSGSESDDSDWSIGWLEPHSHDFHSDDSFAVLVPCYIHNNDSMDLKEKSNDNSFFSALKNLPKDSSSAAESRKYMKQWLSSLHNF